LSLLSLIVAVDQQGIIGYKNQLPWHLPADLQHFRAVTLGKVVIMGRKTAESIGKPLSGRVNVVLSQTRQVMEGYQLVHSLDEILMLNQDDAERIIIGGATVYQQLLPYTQRMYITRIHAHFVGDTFFPAYSPQQWQEIERQDHAADAKNPYAYSFILLTRS
jgi:dihydrofolate reductase